ncbi:hypothetical protein POM88_046210 [Heracleum sosnowskyi]|uniref:Uncharacterized protein n=1 Tax=Heracleum sosnowskyi TaxID=360622 RepID=A0AAD8H8G9_9APIA|nr:hypothetical protein POM88_046210 [Heracleum sosnowskyi]
MASDNVNKEFSLIYRNLASDYDCGSLTLPPFFSEKYGVDCPERIYLKLPCGSIWRGTYIRGKNCIDGLESMFKYYRIKPYQIVYLHYSGGFILDVEIFNTYGVEKEYPKRDTPCEKPIFNRQGGGWVKDVYYLDCDFEVDKLQA